MNIASVARRIAALALLALLVACGGGGGDASSANPGGISAGAVPPPSVVPGATITITGAGLNEVTSVSIGGVSAQFKIVSDTELMVVVPASIDTGTATITLAGPGFSVEVPGTLVLRIPTLSSASSDSVVAGGAIDVTGTRLDTVKTFSVDGNALVASTVTPTSATLTTPMKQMSGAIVLTDVAGNQYTTRYRLSTHLPLQISLLSRASAVVGDSVTVYGTGLDAVTSVAFDNGATAAITNQSSTSLTFVVPARAVAAGGSAAPYTSALTLTTPTEQTTSSAKLTIGPTLVIGETTARFDGAFTIVSITGSNLSLVVGATVGSAAATIVSVTDLLVTFRVVGQANGPVLLSTIYHSGAQAGIVWTTDAGVTALSELDFAQVLDRTGTDRSLRLTPARPLLARAFVSTTVADMSNPGVSLVVSNGSTVLGTLPMNGPATVPSRADANDLTSTYNVTVPAAWVAPGVAFKAVVADQPMLSVNATPAIGGAAKMHIVLVPLTISGVTANVPSEAEVHDIFARTYPLASDSIIVTTRAPFVTADLGRITSIIEEGVLLGQVETLRSQEDPEAFYYGFIPFTMTASSSIGGLGYTGINGKERQSAASGVGFDADYLFVGVDPFDLNTPAWAEVMLHEIGHNHSLAHAPCGDPPAPDQNYPYAGGVLGPQAVYVSSYTDDYAIGSLAGAVTPAGTMTDLMGYCGGIFFSDYSYDKVQTYAEARTLSVSAASKGPTPRAASARVNSQIVISGSIDPTGVSFDPAHATSLTPIAELSASGKYTLRVTTDTQTLTYPVMVNLIADSVEGSARFSSVIPAQSSITKLELLSGGITLGRLDEAAATRARIAAAGGRAELARAASWSEFGGVLRLTWNADREPYAAVTHVADNGTRMVLALRLQGGNARVGTSSVPAGGRFEISFSSMASARLVNVQR